MSLELWAAYVTTVFIFLLSPGPSHLLMLSNSFSCGFGKSWATAAGDLSANTLQIAAASAGLAGAIYASQSLFAWVKWAGVAYLVYLGINMMRRKNAPDLSGRDKGRTRKSLYWQGFITSAANPKAVVFFAALLPQFVNPLEPTAPQFLILGLSYLVIDGMFLALYGRFADFIAQRFERHVARYLNQTAGLLLIGSAVLLGLKDMGER